MDKLAIAIQGDAELLAALESVKDSLTAPELRKLYLAATRIISAKAKELAPRGRYSKNPGLLRRSIAATASRTQKKERVAAVAWVRIFKGLVRAAHAHLVEFGTSGPRYSKSGRLMRFRTADGQWVSTRKVAAMPGSRFFERAVESAGPRALDAVLRDTELVIQNRWTSVRKFIG